MFINYNLTDTIELEADFSYNFISRNFQDPIATIQNLRILFRKQKPLTMSKTI